MSKVNLPAKAKYDEKLEKWVIEVEKDGEKLLLGHAIHDLFFEYEKYDTKEAAINYIENSDRLELIQ